MKKTMAMVGALALAAVPAMATTPTYVSSTDITGAVSDALSQVGAPAILGVLAIGTFLLIKRVVRSTVK